MIDLAKIMENISFWYRPTLEYNIIQHGSSNFFLYNPFWKWYFYV